MTSAETMVTNRSFLSYPLIHFYKEETKKVLLTGLRDCVFIFDIFIHISHEMDDIVHTHTGKNDKVVITTMTLP
jgi:hypothetical protein